MDQKVFNEADPSFGPKWGPNLVSSLCKLNPVRFAYFDHFLDRRKTGLKCLMWAAAVGMPVKTSPNAGLPSGFGTDIIAGIPAKGHEHARESNRISTTGKERGRPPLQDATFDLTTCFDVLEHMDRHGRVLQEIGRVLRSGGSFFFDTINRTLCHKLFVITGSENGLTVYATGHPRVGTFYLAGRS